MNSLKQLKKDWDRNWKDFDRKQKIEIFNYFATGNVGIHLTDKELDTYISTFSEDKIKDYIAHKIHWWC